ncbi:hypothetical protein ACFQ3R_02250 [Mesonia ostreae]|uniref:DUF1735 domain-containing protein n=1 Tax=Mesonia ostreae TaxID=861110 RepID=A0ABU2KLD3_9FLAO|nr:hypothetical protein [Mesonia ostreae]MDT0295530.1 hypothetical protein [Mesonia ostreae]
MKNIKIILMAIIVSTFATSCLVDDDGATEFNQGPAIVGFESDLAQVSYFEDEGVVLKEFPVALLSNGGDGTVSEENISVSYEIDVANSSATEGQEFDFVDTSGVFYIPAGSNTALFPLNINTGNFDPSQRTELILNLTSSSTDGVVISSLHNTLSISFVGCISDVADYTYNVTYTNEDSGSSSDLGQQVIYENEEINSFRTESTGPFAPGGNGEPVDMSGVTFSVLCGDINIPDQGLFQGMFPNLVSQLEDTSVDPETGNFQLKYNVVTGPDSNINVTMNYERL